MIPQPDGTDLPIELKDCTEATETLGVFTSPASKSFDQLDKMLSKAYTWSDRVSTSNLAPWEVWQSFYSQAMPSARYGLGPLMAPPRVVEESFLKWYFYVLPYLNVNRNITTDVRWLPREYQGLGLPNMAIEKLCEMLSFVSRNWGTETGMGIQMSCAYKATQMEIGFNENFLELDFMVYGCLASCSWFKYLWEYLNHFQITLQITGVSLAYPRERDGVLMEILCSRAAITIWKGFNRVRRYKKVMFLSQIVCSDGFTLLPSMLTREEGTNSLLTFSREEPCADDFEDWENGLKLILSPSLHLTPPLGKVYHCDFEAVTFCAMEDPPRRLFKLENKIGRVVCYTEDTTRRTTRSSNRWSFSHLVTGSINATSFPFVVTAATNQDETLTVHSTSRSLIGQEEEEPSDFTLLAQLNKLENRSLWRNHTFQDGGKWVTEAIEKGTLVTVHDGSYMRDKRADVCSAALVLFCKSSQKMGYVTISECTNRHTASNYRGEALGAVLNSLVVFCATRDARRAYKSVQSGCDNMGVVIHANDLDRHLGPKQAQYDVIKCYRDTLRSLSMRVNYEHILGHQDDNIEFRRLPLLAQLNVIADQLAKDELLSSIDTNTFITSEFPHEQIRAYCDGTKIFCSSKELIYTVWGRRVARDFYTGRKIMSEEAFDLVNWEATKAASGLFSHGFNSKIAKMVSHFSPTNRVLSRIDSSIENKCPSCGEINESTDHITKCPDPGRTETFMESVEDLIDWMLETGSSYELADALYDYLEARGRRRMTDIVRDSDDGDLLRYAREHDELGWSNLLEGRVSTTLFLLQETSMHEVGVKMTLAKWSGLFVQNLILMNHRQWLYRNAQVHLKKVEGRTEAEHMQVIEEVKQMMLVDPSELLPRHQHLLEEDFIKLGEGTTHDRIVWLDKMRSAVEAKRAIRTRREEEGAGDGDLEGSSNDSQDRGDNEAQSRCKHLWRPTEVQNTTSSQTLPTETTASKYTRRRESNLTEMPDSETPDNVCPRRSRLRLR